MKKTNYFFQLDEDTWVQIKTPTEKGKQITLFSCRHQTLRGQTVLLGILGRMMTALNCSYNSSFIFLTGFYD